MGFAPHSLPGVVFYNVKRNEKKITIFCHGPRDCADPGVHFYLSPGTVGKSYSKIPPVEGRLRCAVDIKVQIDYMRARGTKSKWIPLTSGALRSTLDLKKH